MKKITIIIGILIIVLSVVFPIVALAIAFMFGATYILSGLFPEKPKVSSEPRCEICGMKTEELYKEEGSRYWMCKRCTKL